MKQLLLMRHAKSSWENPGQEDFDRTLNDRGKKDAPEMGKRFQVRNFKPDLIIASPAKRTLKTAQYVAHELHYPETNIELESSIYQADIEDLVYIIRNFDDTLQNVLMIGHNPAFTGLIGSLGNRLIEHLPTAGAALLSFDIETWKQVSNHSANMVWFDYPKQEA